MGVPCTLTEAVVELTWWAEFHEAQVEIQENSRSRGVSPNGSCMKCAPIQNWIHRPVLTHVPDIVLKASARM